MLGHCPLSPEDGAVSRRRLYGGSAGGWGRGGPQPVGSRWLCHRGLLWVKGQELLSTQENTHVAETERCHVHDFHEKCVVNGSVLLRDVANLHLLIKLCHRLCV